MELKNRMPSLEQRRAESAALAQKWRGMTKDPNAKTKTFVHY